MLGPRSARERREAIFKEGAKNAQEKKNSELPNLPDSPQESEDVETDTLSLQERQSQLCQPIPTCGDQHQSQQTQEGMSDSSVASAVSGAGSKIGNKKKKRIDTTLDETQNMERSKLQRRGSTDSVASSRVEKDEETTNISVELLDTNTIGERVITWIDDVNTCRKKSGNIQGGVSGRMKTKLAMIKEAALTLVTRSQVTTSINSLQNDNTSLVRSNAILMKENAALRKRLQMMEKKYDSSADENQQAVVRKEPMREEVRTSRRIADRLTTSRKAPITTDARDIMLNKLAEQLEGMQTALQNLRNECHTMPPPMASTARNKQLGKSDSYAKALSTRLPPSSLPLSLRREDGPATRSTTKEKTNIRDGNQANSFDETTTAPEKDSEWTEVNRNRRKKKTRKIITRKRERSIPKRKIPNTAAITLRKESGVESYAQLLRKARESISLTELGIETSKV